MNSSLACYNKNEITLDDALSVDEEAEVGAVVQIEETPDNFGRIAAQTTKQVILQRIREAERDALYGVYSEREGEIVNGLNGERESAGLPLRNGWRKDPFAR